MGWVLELGGKFFRWGWSGWGRGYEFVFLGWREEGDVCVDVEGTPSGSVVEFVIERVL